MATSRRRYHHGALRDSVLRAAGNILEKQGLAGLTVRAVARRIGVSHNAPSRHFADRETLLAALAAQGFAMLDKAQREAVAAGGLRRMGEAYVCFALDHPRRFQLMFGNVVPMRRHAALRELATKSCENLSGALAARLPGAQDARDASFAAWALVHGLAQLMLDGRLDPGGRTREIFVRELLATVRFAAGPAQPA